MKYPIRGRLDCFAWKLWVDRHGASVSGSLNLTKDEIAARQIPLCQYPICASPLPFQTDSLPESHVTGPILVGSIECDATWARAPSRARRSSRDSTRSRAQEGSGTAQMIRSTSYSSPRPARATRAKLIELKMAAAPSQMRLAEENRIVVAVTFQPFFPVAVTTERPVKPK